MEPGAGDRASKKSLDGQFAEEVELARELGVSVDRLLGREPSERHEHYDADGVLTGVTVVTRDPEFTSAGVALLLASRRKAVEQFSHGIPLAEAMDPANQFAFEAQEKPAVDYADKALKDAQDRFYDARPKGESRNGHRWGRVTRRT